MTTPIETAEKLLTKTPRRAYSHHEVKTVCQAFIAQNKLLKEAVSVIECYEEHQDAMKALKEAKRFLATLESKDKDHE